MVVLTSWGAQYLDIWTFVHLLGGIALAYAIRAAFNTNLLDSLIVVGVILIGWEVYEGIAKVAEPFITNSVLDFLAGFAGVWIAYQIPLFEEAVKNGARSFSSGCMGRTQCRRAGLRGNNGMNKTRFGF